MADRGHMMPKGEVEVLKIVERLVSTEEMLRRIRYDPHRRRVVYKSPDTGRVIVLEDIPDIAVDHLRPGKAARDEGSSIAARYQVMDDANMKRAMEGNPTAFFADIRKLAALVRDKHAHTKGTILPRLRRAGVDPVHTAPK
jgi:hypothetical protein